MKTVKTTAVLLMLVVFTVSSLFATGAKEIIEQENNQEIVTEVMEEIKDDRVHYGTVNKEDMFSSFSYAYGYAITKSLTSQGISLNGSYWLRGISDVLEGSAETIVSTEDMSSVVDEYATNYYGAGLTAEPGLMLSKEDILLLPTPETLLDKFSYSYGVMYAIQLYYYNGLDITAPEFMEGAADALWENPEQLMTEDEMTAAIDAYAQYLDAAYEEYVAQLAKANLEEAEAFLEENKNTEGIVILPSGNQMIIISEEETLGATPVETDSVVVDYDLFLLDGNQYDAGTDVTFDLQSLIPGFVEAVTNMKVGQEAMVYIHPSFGYGETGTSSIEPNSLLIFRINLKSIAE